MAITIHPPIVVSARRRDGENTTALPLGTVAHSIRHTSGINVWAELDRLFAALASDSAPAASVARGWQKFTEDGTFTVPENVHKLLVLCISAGSTASVYERKLGSVIVSRYLAVNPGESYEVTVSKANSISFGANNVATGLGVIGRSSFGDTLLVAGWEGRYVVDGQAYTYNFGEVVPDDVDICSVGRMEDPQTTDGHGGWKVWDAESDDTLRRAYWLEFITAEKRIPSPSGRSCYPDRTTKADAASYTSGNECVRVGAGHSFGGPAGKIPSACPYPANSNSGSQGIVMVFWGDDITFPPETPLHAIDAENGLPIPIFQQVLAEELPYTNPDAGFTGSTVAEALDEIAMRLASGKTA